MHLFSAPIAIILLVSAETVHGGSRSWESKAPNQRANPTPYYEDLLTLNSTSTLVKRAMSIKSSPGDNSVARIWPNKEIRWCFEEPPSPSFRGQWETALKSWPGLLRHDFTYKEVDDDVCKSESERSSVLHVRYNNRGVLKSTNGIPAIDAAADKSDPDTILGPYTMLSDKEGVGQGDVVANMAHEIGHIWGLHHEHQIPYYWEKSLEHTFDQWNFPEENPGRVKRFQTNGFICSNLKDYDDIYGGLEAKVNAATGNVKKDLQADLDRLCKSRVVASTYKFSAVEWLPLEHTANLVIDSDFDPKSIMLYPSNAGGKGGFGDDREDVMKYSDDTVIPPRWWPSPMDYERLIKLYGSPALSTLEVPHTSKSSPNFNLFKKSSYSNFRKRAGDTKDGVC
ncbi:hypothetical protein J4E85_011358 [Alternaria conjuncta]|uniref:uncharacterized protein n=1 Tax=Alternaria conjuncta TaxID=181017 RepID=UPI00221E8E4F|nr:uncharacterized protein J4E85_011358 [Alternaria conjuncta]KAI4911220.1 hypothetical protein J4E85_011358 [Alternaria conjuncta]